MVGYNARDQVVRQVEPGGNAGEFGEWLTHGYDAYGRPVTLTGDDDYVTDARYDAHGRLTEVAFGNGVRTSTSYWAPNETYGGVGQGGRLHELKTGTVGDPTGVQHLSYAYDKVGNVVSTWDMNNPPTSGYQRTDYVYDALDRLTDAGTSGGDYFFLKALCLLGGWQHRDIWHAHLGV